MSEIGMVNNVSFTRIQELFDRGGFYAVLRHLNHGVSRLTTLTTDLITSFQGLEARTGDGELNVVVEQNEPGNIKVPFARLYTAWTHFVQEFLASSMISHGTLVSIFTLRLTSRGACRLAGRTNKALQLGCLVARNMSPTQLFRFLLEELLFVNLIDLLFTKLHLTHLRIIIVTATNNLSVLEFKH